MSKAELEAERSSDIRQKRVGFFEQCQLCSSCGTDRKTIRHESVIRIPYLRTHLLTLNPKPFAYLVAVWEGLHRANWLLLVRTRYFLPFIEGSKQHFADLSRASALALDLGFRFRGCFVYCYPGRAVQVIFQ